MTIDRKLQDPFEALKAIKEFRQLNVDAETADKNQDEFAKETLTEQITQLKPVIQGIMTRIDQDTNTDRLNRSPIMVAPSSRDYFYTTPINQCDRLIGIIENDSRLQQIIGSHEPFLSSSRLAADVTEAAASYWSDRHYTEAVRQSYLKLERKAQQILGTEVGGSNLWEQCFAKTGGLKISEIKGNSKTKDSVQQGLRRLAQSASLLIRNPISHTPTEENGMSEEEALEYLAILSCLSRWLDRCSKNKD